MILSCYDERDRARLVFLPQEDHPYSHTQWLTEVTAKIYGVSAGKWRAGPYRIGMIGYEKDDSSFYLRDFPQWAAIPYTPTRMINATDIRRDYFGFDEDLPEENFGTVVPDTVQQWLQDWSLKHATIYHNIVAEWQFIDTYRKGWEKAPYPPTFVTVDNVIIQAAHVLMVVRKDRPGQGLLALPGGFVKVNQTIEEAQFAELDEETRIKVPPAVLKGSIKAHRVFDDPLRSLRGRTITHATLIRLEGETLPKVKGGDDALKARWIPLALLRRDQCFEDHYSIIQTMNAL